MCFFVVAYRVNAQKTGFANERHFFDKKNINIIEQFKNKS